MGKIAPGSQVGHQGVYARLFNGLWRLHDFAHADRRSYAPLPTLRLRASGIIASHRSKYHRQMQTSGRKSYRIDAAVVAVAGLTRPV